MPRVCLNDLGVSIPFTQICITIKDLVIMPRGVIGTLVGNIDIGATFLQYKGDDMVLSRFSMGVGMLNGNCDTMISNRLFQIQ